MPKKPHISPTLYMTDTLEYTLCIIKPDAMPYRKDILRNIMRHGFMILLRKRFQISPEQAAEFYQEYEKHKTYMLLILNLSNGPVEAAILTKEDAVDKFIGLMGPDKPSAARCMCPGSLRALYGDCEDDLKNAVHGSLSLAAANREIHYFFPNFIIDPLSRDEPKKLCCNVALMGPLMTGLQQLSKARPGEAVLWLAKWLLNNNPNRPAISDMTLEECLLQEKLGEKAVTEPCPESVQTRKTSSTSESETTSTPSSGTTSSGGTASEKMGSVRSAMVCSCSASMKTSETDSRENLAKTLCCCNVQVKPGEIAVCPLCEKIIQYTVPTDKPPCEGKDSSSTRSTPDSDEKDVYTPSEKSSQGPCGRKDPCLPCLSKSTSTSPNSTPASSISSQAGQKDYIIEHFVKGCVEEKAEEKDEQKDETGKQVDNALKKKSPRPVLQNQ